MNKLLVLLAACAVTSIAAKNYCGGTMIERDEQSMMAEDNGQLIVTNEAGFPVQVTVHPVSKSVPASTEILADGAENVSIGQSGVCFKGVTIETTGPNNKIKHGKIFMPNEHECKKHRHLTIKYGKTHDGTKLYAYWTHDTFYNQE